MFSITIFLDMSYRTSNKKKKSRKSNFQDKTNCRNAAVIRDINKLMVIRKKSHSGSFLLRLHHGKIHTIHMAFFLRKYNH